jgi:hypothetical protein
VNLLVRVGAERLALGRASTPGIGADYEISDK